MKTAAPVFKSLDDVDCRALLARHRVGRLAYSQHDRIDIEPVNYVFDGSWLFGRTNVGTKLAALVHHPWCAFEVDEVHGLFDWMSVVVKGSFYLLDPETGSPDTYRRALQLLTALIPEMFTADDPVPHRAIVFGIYAHEVTGRGSFTDRE